MRRLHKNLRMDFSLLPILTKFARLLDNLFYCSYPYLYEIKERAIVE